MRPSLYIIILLWPLIHASLVFYPRGRSNITLDSGDRIKNAGEMPAFNMILCQLQQKSIDVDKVPEQQIVIIDLHYNTSLLNLCDFVSTSSRNSLHRLLTFYNISEDQQYGLFIDRFLTIDYLSNQCPSILPSFSLIISEV